ncbi:MAG: Gfo/Idh/MocA family oxidoreductase [Rhodocyclales bacterium]|nr:Gfo/Idh/MocA family oxidoreductase [Rhodocyclales bacterium]
MKVFSAAIAGLGNIGLRYDMGAQDDQRVASHARAFAVHPGYSLVAGIDPDEAGRALFEQHYHVPAFTDIAAMRSAGIRPEVWSIAVPTPLHFRTFQDIIALRPVAVLCEKPLAQDVVEAARMVTAAEECNCALAVNYMRRFEPGVLALWQSIAEGALGEIYKGCAWYSKGLLNNGSHVIDLLSFLLGDAGPVQVLNAGRTWEGQDPEPDLCLGFGAARVVLLAAREECFSHIGFDLVGTGGTVRYSDGGHRIELRRARAEPTLPGYRLLANDAEVLPTDLKRYQWHAVDALHRHLEGGAPLASSGQSALATLRTIDQARIALVKLQENGRNHD